MWYAFFCSFCNYWTHWKEQSQKTDIADEPNRPAKRYYKVLEKTDEKLLLYEDTTYRKASLGCKTDDNEDA